MIINPRLEIAAAIRDAFRVAEKKLNNKFTKGWSVARARKAFYAQKTATTASFETVEQFLARGGKVTKVENAEIV